MVQDILNKKKMNLKMFLKNMKVSNYYQILNQKFQIIFQTFMKMKQ